jgi:ubiquinone/menaquinone biosynthesis C-methylase UbiE
LDAADPAWQAIRYNLVDPKDETSYRHLALRRLKQIHPNPRRAKVKWVLGKGGRFDRDIGGGFLSYQLNKDEELAREHLTRLERMEDPGTIACLERIGVASGWRCLEVGAGGGSIARWLSERVGDEGRVVATDIDTTFLEGLATGNLEVKRHDIVEDPLEKKAFDLVHERNVLVHMAEREPALEKMAAAVKPGGWLLIEEPDLVTDGPDSATPKPLADLYVKVSTAIYAYLRTKGLELDLGARLLRLLQSVGFESLRCEGRVTMFQGGSAGAESPHMMAFAHLKDAVLAEGEVREQDYDAFLDLPNDPRFVWREGLTMAAWGRKPMIGQ